MMDVSINTLIYEFIYELLHWEAHVRVFFSLSPIDVVVFGKRLCWLCRHMTIHSVWVSLSLIWLWWCITNADCYTSLSSIIIQFDNKSQRVNAFSDAYRLSKQRRKKKLVHSHGTAQWWKKICEATRKKSKYNACNDLTMWLYIRKANEFMAETPVCVVWQIVCAKENRENAADNMMRIGGAHVFFAFHIYWLGGNSYSNRIFMICVRVMCTGHE